MVTIILLIAALLAIVGLILTGIPYDAIKPELSSYGWFATNVFSGGVFSMGLFSAGVFSAGLFSVGIFSIGIFSIGIFSVGSFSFVLAYLYFRSKNHADKK
jgi:hypothetical protein